MGGCKDDDTVPAEATLEASSDQLVNGIYRGVVGATDNKGKLTIHLEGIVPAGIKSLEIIRNYNNDAGPQTSVEGIYEGLVNKKEIDLDFVYTVQRFDIEAETELKAVVIDNRDREVILNLAQVEAFWPLDLTSNVTLDSDTEEGIQNYAYYMTVLNAGNELDGKPKIDPQATNVVSLELDGIYNKVHLIYDYDIALKGVGLGAAPVGSYLCSPFQASTSNPDLVTEFTVKNQTVLKIITYSSLTDAEKAQLENIGVNDVALLMGLYDNYQPSATTERVTFNGAQGDEAFVLFKTNQGKIGLIKDYEITEGSEASIKFDFWIML
ncbi:hypothetical protein SanaruYs_22970 [Chryseotalea sanaruensis]|uniref:Uncharacterized protein n=2 Tax=Chryseotalea sanaruensis TaxID=2482724 RepID=A0A401UB05_9BACT|nr:hypothetical protein SanaruYs_22970 [Chryseotalea sanaruensis]